MKYVKPSVKFLSQSIPNLGYYAWLKSRQWVITDLEGKRFMVDFPNPTESWMASIPDEFYVGDEKVNKYEYLNRVDKMNLQYNNLEYQVFEITGSCLFRDMLFNINKVAAWAQSNRFLFSILGEDSREDEDNYMVSKEYEGIPEWDAQFRKYMDAIHSDGVVDHNRVEMPYSISSTFWIGINKKTICDFLSFLKNQAPFFYEVYGKQFELWIGGEIPTQPSSAITQYLLKEPEKFKEMSTNIQGTQIVNSKMGLILYSQFIRQADTRVCGLFNEIIHSDPEEFKHKVFKGGTILNIHYVADITKALSTVKTRLCAFAMSSGNDPCSWSYFLNNFLPEDLSPEVFKNMLPCEFKGCKLMDCKFKDDIKFRNEGKEVSNCPCPIFTMNMEHAEAKKSRDGNRIGDAYYDLTKYLINSGLNFEISAEWWTSNLSIRTNSEVPSKVIDVISGSLKYWESEWRLVNKSGAFGVFDSKLSKYANLFPDGDFTCAMKGMAIDMIAENLNNSGIESYIINFGGDIYCHNVDTKIFIEDTKFRVEVTKDHDWSVFTSGNTTKRGNHISGCPSGQFITLVIKWNPTYKPNNTSADIIATKFAANDESFHILVDEAFDGITGLIFDSESKELLNSTYCASPFFDEYQIKVRDNMASKFARLFRPDLTKESLEYEECRNNETVVKVVDANIDGIEKSQFLVYPSRTTDLGTLWELGYALSQSLDIIKYDEVDDTYTIEINSERAQLSNYGELNLINISTEDNYLFDCTNKVDVISLGYLSHYISPDKIYYQLNGMNDNIMLSVRFHHVELVKGVYVEYERDQEDRDK